MKVLVTGHKGYIGSVLLSILEKDNHTVTGLDNEYFVPCVFGKPPDKVNSLKKDIRDIGPDDLKGFDAVIHLAGLSNDPLGDLNPSLTHDINYRATVRLAELAKNAGVKRFLFSSSCSNYGTAGNNLVDEDAEQNPQTPYARSKIAAETELATLAESDFSPTFLRSGTAYGLSPYLRFDLVLNNLTAWAYTTGNVHLKSDGSAWRPVVHVEDISSAFAAVLNADRQTVHNQAFNVGRADENYQVHELAKIVQEIVPNSRIEYETGASADSRTYKVDCGKITRALPQFKPKWNARKGAIQLYTAFKKTGLCLEDFEGVRYKRISHIKYLMDKNLLDKTLRWTDTFSHTNDRMGETHAGQAR